MVMSDAKIIHIRNIVLQSKISQEQILCHNETAFSVH